MAKPSAFLLLLLIFTSVNTSFQLQSSQSQTLLRLRQLLNFPSVLDSWNNTTDFCNTEPSQSLTVVCYEDNITQLHIIGTPNESRHLHKSFSINSLFTTLVKIPNLKVLTLVSLGLWGHLPRKIERLSTLEILNISSNYISGSIPQELSYLTGLRTLILDHNMFSGPLPDWLHLFPGLTALSLRHNMFNGSLPSSLSSLFNLRILELSCNRFYGNVPDLSSLTNLQVLDLESNGLGPLFPQLGDKVVRLVLSKNRFRSNVPAEASSYYQLEILDLSSNIFIGPFPVSILSLPSIRYLNISNNKFTGMLLANLSCNTELNVVDLSSNLLTGNVPTALVSDMKNMVLRYNGNCLSTEEGDQKPLKFCRTEALAVGIIPQRRKQKKPLIFAITMGIIGGIIGGIILVGSIFLVFKKINAKRNPKKLPTRLIAENASVGYTSKLLLDARYISQKMKLESLGLPAYRTFSLEELENATNKFHTSAFMGEGSLGQMYKGQLKDGPVVAIWCLKVKKSYSTQNYMNQVELISKLRHGHLVSSLGHCFESYLDDSTISRIFFVFENVSNGTLRSRVSEGRSGQPLSWEQRIAAALGVAKGIQFLHTGIVPAVYSNNLKITDVLLDNNHVAKIKSYNLPVLAENARKAGHGVSSSGGSKDPGFNARESNEDKIDVFDIGVILLEIITGKPIETTDEVDILKDQLEASLVGDDVVARRRMVDPAVERSCSEQSLKTTMAICVRCLQNNLADRPSVEDILWNLQFASQVSISNEESPASRSPGQSPRLSQE